MNKEKRAILYGLAIGDGHISYRTRLKDGKYRYEQAELIIGHSVKQQNYIEYKANIIQSIFGGNKPKVSSVKHLVNDKEYFGLRIAKTNKYFRQMHKVLYKKDKRKFISKQVLSFLNEQSLALWFMDDGSINHNTNKKGIITSINLRIATQCSEEEANNISDWLLQKYNIMVKPYPSKGRYDLGTGTQESIKFVLLIFDYLENSMFYKLKPLAKLTICKSAKHPNYFVDDDIVQSIQNKMNSVDN